MLESLVASTIFYVLCIPNHLSYSEEHEILYRTKQTMMRREDSSAAKWTVAARDPRGMGRLSSSIASSRRGISGSSTLSNELEDRVKDAVTSCGSRTGLAASLAASFATSFATSLTASGSGIGDKDAPFTVEVSDSKSQLVLLDLKLQLADGLVDDESVGRGIKLADLALADVKSVWEGVLVQSWKACERKGGTYCRQ
jgi:hypothetical protein